MAPLVFRVTAVMLLATLMSTTTAKPSSSLAGLIRDLTSMRSSMASGSDIMDHLLGQGASSMLSGLASTIPSGISQKISSYYQSMSSAPATDNEANSILNVSSGATMDSQGSQLPLSDTAGFRTGAPPNVSGVVFNLTQAATDVATLAVISNSINFASGILANVGYFQAADASSINIIIAEINLLASRGLLGLNGLSFEQTLYNDFNSWTGSKSNIFSEEAKYLKSWRKLRSALLSGRMQADVKSQMGQIEASKSLLKAAIEALGG